MKEVAVYTDGSCHTQKKAGAWVAILLGESGKTVLSGNELDTTHNRMELTAVVKAIEYIKDQAGQPFTIRIYSDSQYVIGLPGRKQKLRNTGFITKKGNELNNTDLLKILFAYLDNDAVEFVKVKAHQKKTGIINYNIEADLISRKLMKQLPYL